MSNSPRKSSIKNKLWADIYEEIDTTQLPDPLPLATTVHANESSAPTSSIDPLTNHLKSWHLSAKYNVVLDKLRTSHLDKLKAKNFVEYEMEEESVANIIWDLMDSTILIYFIEKLPSVFSIKAWATREFQENHKWPIE